jgi:hypothetical protein
MKEKTQPHSKQMFKGQNLHGHFDIETLSPPYHIILTSSEAFLPKSLNQLQKKSLSIFF